MITRRELINKYLEFFKSKGHKEIPNSSLVPRDDPTVLFTTAGMHPLVPYLLGQKHPLGKKLVNVQGCIRTTDIEEVGDSTHHTFFEMLGYWSLGDYWKEEAIRNTFEFHTKILKIPLEKYAVSCFAGDKDAPKDLESAKIWKSLGIPSERITFLGKKDNWWGPAGNTGPCGPDTEQFFWSVKSKPPKKFNSEDKGWVEIGNDVLMQYIKDEKGNFKEANQKNVDFGGGVERTLAILNGIEDNYLTEVWKPIIEKIEELSGKRYGATTEKTRAMRIVADHVKASVMVISQGITPSNKDRGYILRRLIRRAVWNRKNLDIESLKEIAETVFDIYLDYPELRKNKKKIISEIDTEEKKFNSTLKDAIRKFNTITKDKPKKVSSKDMFLLFQSFGMPKELIEEELGKQKIPFPEKEFQEERSKHQALSKTSSSGTFKSGLADNSEQTTKLHTATHLLNEALREILDRNITQKGSNITPERLRFDFNFPRKLTDEEKQKIEDRVNEKIKENLTVDKEDMPLKKALSSGAQGEFGARYPEIVSVYTIGKFSKEICTGPHVKNTKEIGKFKILKEESVATGIRRIKAAVSK